MIFARKGVELSRALLSNWVDARCQLMSSLNDALYLHKIPNRQDAHEVAARGIRRPE